MCILATSLHNLEHLCCSKTLVKSNLCVRRILYHHLHRLGGLPRLPAGNLSFFEILRFLRTQRGQYQSVFSAGSEVMPTQSQWYQSSHLSQPIIGEPSSLRLHVGQIQIWRRKNKTKKELKTFVIVC